MTYNVFGGTLNLALFVSILAVCCWMLSETRSACSTVERSTRWMHTGL